jgi:signal peptidase I
VIVVVRRKRKMKRKKMGTILLTVGTVLVVISALGLLLAYFNHRENDYLIVISGSMEPIIQEWDVVMVKLGVDSDEIYAAPKDSHPAGDIIVFHRPYSSHELIVHRAIEKRNENGDYIFKTQGDANSAPDSWEVKETDIVGKVLEINPPFWTYNFLFLGGILVSGIVCVVVGVVYKRREPKKVGIVEEKPITVVKPVPSFLCQVK